MATQKDGPHGKVNGKLGNLVHYKLKEKDVVRHMGWSNKPASLRQLAVRQRMKVVTNFLYSNLDFINLGYATEIIGTDKNQHNIAVSYNFKHATTGEYPDIEMDYSKVMVSKGTLDISTDVTLIKTHEAIEVSWNIDGLGPYQEGADRSMVLVCFPLLNESMIFFNEVQRCQGKFTQLLSLEDLNKEMEVYLAFSNIASKSTSPSVWARSIPD